MSRPAASAVLALILLGAAFPSGPRADDGAEIALWNVVRKSQDPADYTTFLRMYPSGRFAALAKVKLIKLGGTPPAVAEQAPAQTLPAPGQDDPLIIYKLEVWPRVATMGQSVTVRCQGFAAPALYDRIVVVRAGTPDFNAAGKVDEKQLLWNGLPNLYDCAGAGITLPMMFAGRYEVRYLSRQYNPDGVLEVVARAGFQNR